MTLLFGEFTTITQSIQPIAYSFDLKRDYKLELMISSIISTVRGNEDPRSDEGETNEMESEAKKSPDEDEELGEKDKDSSPAKSPDKAPLMSGLTGSRVVNPEYENAMVPIAEPRASGNTDRTSTQKKCCKRTMDIISISCLFLMAIFFITGSSIIHPKTSVNLAEPYTFYLFGTLFYIAFACLDLIKRIPNGVFEIVNGSIQIFAGVLWFIGSIFLFSSTFNVTAWAALTMIGSITQLYVITCDIVFIFRKPIQPFFRAVSLVIVWFGNLFFFGGSASWIAYGESAGTFSIYGNTYYTGAECISNNAANVMISGSVMYFFHALFQVMAIWCFPRLIFTMDVSRV